MDPLPTATPKKMNLLSGFTLRNIFKWVGFIAILFAVFIPIQFYVISPYAQPKDVRVTNVTSRSATVSWVTDKPSRGVVIYGEDNSFRPGVAASLGQSKAYDDRDVAIAVSEGAESLEADLEERDAVISASELGSELSLGALEKFYVHHVTIKDLDPSQEYFFMIGDGIRFTDAKELFSTDEFTIVETNSFTTFPELEDLERPNPTYGKVVPDSGGDSAIDDGIFFIRPGLGSTAAPLSSVLNSDGNWYVDISNIRDQEVPVNILSFDESEDSHAIFVDAGEYGQSQYLLEPMDADAPLVDIMVSNDWDEEEEEESSLGSLILGVFAGNRNNKENDNGKINKIYAEQLIRRANRGDKVPKADLDKLRNDRPDMAANLDIPAPQEKGTSSGGGGGGRCSQSSDGGPTDTHVIVGGESYMAYCCNNGLWDAASKGDNACSTRGGLAPAGTTPGVTVADDEDDDEDSDKDGRDEVWCDRPNFSSPKRLSRDECQKIRGSIEGDVQVWCDGPQFSTPQLTSSSNCTASGGTDETVLPYDPSETTYVSGDEPPDTEEEGRPDNRDVQGGARCGSVPVNTTVTIDGNSYVCSSAGILRTVASREWVPVIDESGAEVVRCFGGINPPAPVNGQCPSGYEEGYTLRCDSSEGCYCPDGSFVGNGRACNRRVIGAWSALADGERCPSGQNCWCPGGEEKNLSAGESCSTIKVEPAAEEEEVLTPTVEPVPTPEAPDEEPTGTPEPPESSVKGVSDSVFAQSAVTISPQNGVFAVENTGIYCTEYNSEKYCFNVTDTGENMLFVDANSNGSFDTGDVDLGTDGVNLAVTLELKTGTYRISEGFNFVSFNFVSTEIGTTAKAWMTYLNEKYDDAFYSIAKFESGKWVVVENRDGETYGTDDFQIIPGNGYLLKSKYDLLLNLSGKAVVDPVPVSFNTGWNLIGIHGSSKAYTAELLIDSVNSDPDIVVDNVTKWDKSRSRYIGLEKEINAVYGLDYPLIQLESYFVRVQEGKSIWTPE